MVKWESLSDSLKKALIAAVLRIPEDYHTEGIGMIIYG
jgi:hypothetical protein